MTDQIDKNKKLDNNEIRGIVRNQFGEPVNKKSISWTTAERETKNKLEKISLSNKDVIFHHPPTIQPEQYIPDITSKHNLSITYLTPNNKSMDKMVDWCQSAGLEATILSSNKEECDSYSGEYGEDYADHIQTLYEKQDIGLGELHATGELRCQPNCPFVVGDQEDYTDYDVLIGYPTAAYMKKAREDRTIYVDGLTGDEFITTITNPDKKLTPYLQEETDFSDYQDFIRNRNNVSKRPSLRHDLVYDDLAISNQDRNRALEGDGHILSQVAFFGLLYSVQLNNDWETTYHHRNLKPPSIEVPTNRYVGGLSGPDRWNIAGLDYNRHRVVRNPGDTIADDEIYVFRPPDFSLANGVIGLDVDPINQVWNTCYGVDFAHKRVLDQSQTKTFLRQTMDITVVQVANSLKPYDGKHITEGKDASVTLWAGIEFDAKPIVCSTKDGLNSYRDNQPKLLHQDACSSFQYRRGHSINTQDPPLIIAHGAPRPRNDDIQLLGALMGESVTPQTNSNQSLGKVGDKIRHQFMHARVGQSVTAFRGSAKGATIILNTTAHPKWLHGPSDRSVDVTNILPANASAKRDIVRFFRDRANNPVAIQEIVNGADVSENSVRSAIAAFHEYGWIIEHDIEEGRLQYKYEWMPKA